jgi:hypothetical protein
MNNNIEITLSVSEAISLAKLSFSNNMTSRVVFAIEDAADGDDKKIRITLSVREALSVANINSDFNKKVVAAIECWIGKPEGSARG